MTALPPLAQTRARDAGQRLVVILGLQFGAALQFHQLLLVCQVAINAGREAAAVGRSREGGLRERVALLQC